MSEDVRINFIGDATSFARAAASIRGDVTKTSASFAGLASGLGRGIGGETGLMIQQLSDNMGNLGMKGQAAGPKLMAAGGAITGLGVAMQAMGSKHKQATDQLKQSIENTGQSYSKYTDDIDSAIKHQENFGHSAIDSQEALRKLTQATNDPKKALSEMGVVANLAAARHESLSEAAGQVAKVHGGAGRILKEFGITLEKNADGTKNSQKALDELSKKLSGQAAASVDNFGAKVGIARTHITDFAAGLAEKVGPAVTVAGPALFGVGAILETGIIGKAGKAAKAVSEFGAGLAKSAIEAGRAVVTLVAHTAATVAHGIATAAVRVATLAWTAAQWLLNAALTANPIGLIVIAIAALVVAFVLAYKHSETFRNIVTAALHGVVVAFQWLRDIVAAVFGWIQDHWPLLLIIILGPLGLIIVGVIKNFSTIRDFITTAMHVVMAVVGAVWGFIAGYIGAQVAVIRAVIGWFASLPGLLGGWFGHARDVVAGALGGLVGIVAGIPGRIVQGLGNLAGLLTQAGKDVVGGMITGIWHMLSALNSMLGGIPKNIVSAIGNLGSLLLQAGKDIIGGLISGIWNMLGPLKSMLQGIGKLIPSWKGPPAVDAELLVGSGQKIMGGLMKGINSSVPALQRTLKNVTGQISLTPTAVGRASYGAPGGSVTVNVTLENHGAIGSEIELQNWLERRLTALVNTGRLSRTALA